MKPLTKGLGALAVLWALLGFGPGAFSSPDAKILPRSAWSECVELLQSPAQYRAQLFLGDLKNWRRIAQRTPIENYMIQIEPALKSHLRWARWLNSPAFDSAIQKQIRLDYPWARDHAVDLKRIYDRILLFVTPEARNFPALAKKIGPTLAYKRVWEQRAFLTHDKGGALAWEDLTGLIRSLQSLLKTVSEKEYRTGPAHFILGGSVINGQGRPASDLDGGALPIHFLHEPEVQNYLKQTQDQALLKWLKRLDHRLISTSFNREIGGLRGPMSYDGYEKIWRRSNLLNFIQAFALRIYADRVELVYFKPHFENTSRVQARFFALDLDSI